MSIEGRGDVRGQQSPPAVRFSFRAKLTILALLLAVVPLTAAGLSLLDVNAGTVKSASRDLFLAVIEDIGHTLDAELVEAEDGLEAVGRALTDTRLAEDARVGLAINLVEASSALDHAGIYAADGQWIDTIREEVAPRDVLPAQLAEPLRQRAQEHNIASADVSLVAGALRVLVVVPLRVSGRTTGYAASFISLQDVQERIERIAAARFAQHPDALFVVDDRLQILAHADRERLGSLARGGILEGVDPRALAMGLARSGEYEAADGTAMVGAMASLTHRQWAVIAQIPRDHAYASLYRMRRIVLGVLGASVVAAIAAAIFLARRLSSPVRRLSEFAGDLAARRFERRVVLDTGDELATLAAAMSSAAGDLAESEQRIRQEVAIRADLGRYLPAELVDKVVRREQDMALGGVRREVSILFADIVAFTPLTEKLGAEEVVAMLNELFTILTEIVFRHGGTVDKFIGDCVMAIWGAPTPQPDHAALALAAAEDMIRWLEAGNVRWREQHGITIQLAIGVHSGEAIVGNIGSETRMEYTAIGEVVNVAARLESIARPQQILITAATRDAAGAAFEYAALGPRTLTGHAEPLELFEVHV